MYFTVVIDYTNIAVRYSLIRSTIRQEAKLSLGDT